MAGDPWFGASPVPETRVAGLELACLGRVFSRHG